MLQCMHRMQRSPRGVYFIYKFIVGSLMASANIALKITRSHIDSKYDILGVTIDIKRNGNFSIRLLGGDVRVVNCVVNR
jgi:hypothetical protein